MIRTGRDTFTLTQVHGAIAEYCQLTGDGPEHSRALMDDVRAEPPSDWPWYLDYFTRRRMAIVEASRMRAAA